MNQEKNRLSSINKFLTDICSYMPSKIISSLITVIMTVFFTCLFSPGDYGNYILVTTTVTMLYLLPSSALGSSAVRYYPFYEKNSMVDIFYGTFIRTLLYVISVTAFFFWISIKIVHISPELYKLFHAGVFLFISEFMFRSFLQILNARRKIVSYSYFCIFNDIFRLFTGIVLAVLFGAGISGILYGSIIVNIILMPFIYFSSIGRIRNFRLFSMPVFIELFKYGVPLSIGNLSDFIIKLSDRYIIGLYRSSFEVGLYNASYLIAENSIVMIYNLITKPAYPLLVHLWEQEGKEAVQEFLNKTTFYYLLIAFPASLGLSVLAKPVVEIFTGPSYHEGYKIIPFVTFGAFFLGLQWWARAGLLLYKKTRMVMYGVIFGSILNIILNIILVPKYGYMAAACTTLLSYVSVFLYMTFISQKFLPWKFPFKSFVKIIFASSIMAISVNFLSENFTDSKKINLFSSIFIGIIIYFLIIFFLKELNFKEIKSLFNKYSGKDGKIWQ